MPRPLTVFRDEATDITFPVPSGGQIRFRPTLTSPAEYILRLTRRVIRTEARRSSSWPFGLPSG